MPYGEIVHTVCRLKKLSFVLRYKVSRLLAEEHNALHCQDYSGRSPLHEAVRKNHPKIVDILLDEEPRMMHRKCEHWQEVDKEELRFDELGEYFADICHCGYAPLHLAARYGRHQLAILLLEKGARLDDRDCTGATPTQIVHTVCRLKKLSFVLRYKV